MTDALAAILGDFPRSTFATQVFGRAPLHLKERFGHTPLFGWQQLNAVLNSSGAIPANFRILKEGKEQPVHDYLTALRDLRLGHSAIFEDIDRFDPVLAAFLSDLSRSLRCPTRFNMYLSSPGRQGRRLHYDTHDVFVFQVEGEKKWTVYEKTDENAIDSRKSHMARDPDPGSATEFLLASGDVLYLPRGFWHDVVPTTEVSLHLTLGMLVPNGIAFLAWLVDECTEDVVVRSNMPLRAFCDSDEEYSEQRRHFCRQVLDALVRRAASSELAQSHEDFLCAGLPNRTPFNFPHAIGHDALRPGDDAPIRAAVHHLSLSLRDLGLGAGIETVLVFSNRLLRFPAGQYAMLSAALGGEFCSIAGLASHHQLDRDQVRQAVRALLAEGLLLLDAR